MASKKRRLKDEKAARAAKKRKSRRKKRAMILIVELLILVVLGGAAYAMIKYDKFQTVAFGDGDIKVNEGVKKEGYTTIALFGGDSRDGALEEGTHTDCIIIASIDNKTKNVKLASVYRDTLTEQMDGTLKKVNNAYFVGGPKGAINVLNKNFDLDIQNYATVDFKALVDTIDLLGGIEIDVQPEEVQYLNEFLGETAEVAGTAKETEFIQESGIQTLNGTQAVTYARIRSTAGGDFKRTERQRLVVEKVFEKVKGTKLGTINKIVDKVFPQVSTSFSLPDLIGLAAGVTQYELGETTGFPKELGDAKIKGVGATIVPLGLQENVKELHSFLYANEAYTVSETVDNIGSEIVNLTGLSRADIETPEEDTTKSNTN
ncbi:MAG: LCP family protein [Lachnospiraceae bacterium]